MFIAIDTAKGLRYTGVVSGSSMQLYEFYKAMGKILMKAGTHSPYHWHNISRKVRGKARKGFNNLVNDFKLNFNVFEHERRPKCERKEFFLKKVPYIISEHYEPWLKFKRGNVQIIVDNDYNIKNLPNGTEHFIKNLMMQLSLKLINKEATIRHEGRVYKMTIKKPNGFILDLYGRTSSIKESKEIQVIDMFLGYCLEKQSRFYRKKFFIRKIK